MGEDALEVLRNQARSLKAKAVKLKAEAREKLARAEAYEDAGIDLELAADGLERAWQPQPGSE